MAVTENCLYIPNNPDDTIQCENKYVNTTIQTTADKEAIEPFRDTLEVVSPKSLAEENQGREHKVENPQVMYVQKFSIILMNNPNSLTDNSGANLAKKFKMVEENLETYLVAGGPKHDKLAHLTKWKSTEQTESQQTDNETEGRHRSRSHSVKELKDFFENANTINLYKKSHNSIYNGYTQKPSLKKIKEEALLSGKFHKIKQSFEDPTFKFRPQSTSGKMSFEKLVEADEMLIEEMSLALEKGDIVEVAKIVNNNPHLVNVVPPRIGLGALHQAAIKGEVNIVNKLLYYPASNPEIQTTASERNKYGAGKIAEELTNSEEVRVAIQTKKHQLSMAYVKCPTLVDIPDSNLILMDYTIPSLESNRGTICSDMFQSNNFEVYPKMMEDVFLYAHYTSNWEVVKAKACEELIRFDNQLANHINKLETRESFYNSLLELYTSAKLAIFKNVNEEIRNQAVRKYISQVRLSLYAAIVSSILFVWEDLQPYTEPTYRGMKIAKEDLDKYSVGTEFAWLAFVSSSKDQKVANKFGNSLFIFDNKQQCKWSPKSIENVSKFKKEKEYLYPCGAQFKVTNVETVDNKTHIYLELISTVDPTPPRSLFDETVEAIKKDIETVDQKVKQFGNDLNELNETVHNGNGTENKETNEVHTEEEIKAKIEELLSTMEDDKSEINKLLKEIKQNFKLLKYGLTGGESIGKNILNKIFGNKNNEKQLNQIQSLKEKVRPVKKLMKKHQISFNDTSEFAKDNVF